MPNKSKTRPPKTFIIPWVLYPFDVMVSTDTYDAVVKRLKRYCDLTDEDIEKLELPEREQGRCILLSSSQTVIRLRQPPDTPKRIAVLSHEVFHAVSLLFRRMGIRLSRDSEEAFAYAIEYLTEKILIEFKR